MGSIFMTRAETRGLPPVVRRGDKYGEAVLNKSWTGAMPFSAKYFATRLGVMGATGNAGAAEKRGVDGGSSKDELEESEQYEA